VFKLALKLLPNGRWRDTQTGRYAKAPVITASGRYKDRATGRFVKVITPKAPTIYAESPTAGKPAVKQIPRKIITGDEFVKKYGRLPPLEYASNEAITFKRGVVNMGVVKATGRKNQAKLRKMDANKLLKLYNENPTMFDMYFQYEDSSFDVVGYWEPIENDVVELLIQKYESKYGAL